jgi:hypothetical protein
MKDIVRFENHGCKFTMLDYEYHSFDDEPSNIFQDGTVVWHKHGKIHREGKPAHISSKVKIWAIEGMYHRTDGAAILGEGIELYYINGERYSIEDYLLHTDVSEEFKTEYILSH